jgi:transcriptional regulator with XRE-family HTH domain
MSIQVGKAIKKARIDKGWNQKQLVEATGLTQKYMSEIELNKVMPRVDVLVRIADALSVSIDQLIVRIPEDAAQPPTRTRKAVPVA